MVRKHVSPAMLAANRANGAKARGPVTDRGKSVSRYNAAKHWGRAEVMRSLMPALGEQEEDFDSFRNGLYDSLQPEDAFEALLVDDMADIHWRLRRMIRAEAGALAKQRREEKARLEEQEAAKDSGRLHDLEPEVIRLLGFIGLGDSAPKFTRILERLSIAGLQVEREGFDPGGLKILEQVYGPNPGTCGKNLISIYKHGLEAKQAGETEVDKECQAAVQGALQKEIAWFKQRAASERQARAELRAPRIEAAMLHGEFDPVKSITYQEKLERRFERKWRLLMRYRARRYRALTKPVRDEDSETRDLAGIEDANPVQPTEVVAADAAALP